MKRDACGEMQVLVLKSSKEYTFWILQSRLCLQDHYYDY